MAKTSKHIVPLLFQKSINNSRSSKFSLTSKQGEKRFETHSFLSLDLSHSDVFETGANYFCELVLFWSSSTSAAGGESLNLFVLASPVKIQVGSILRKHRNIIDNLQLQCATMTFDPLVTVQFHSNLNLKRGGFDVVKMLPKT
jgi:hypothetical protein